MMNTRPKGQLLLIGGAEDKGDNDNYSVLSSRHIQRLEILNLLIPMRNKRKGIEIITTASSIPDQICEMYEGAFKRIGFKKVGFINMTNHPEARNPLFIKRVRQAHAVLFSGGDQFRLSTILGNTDVLEAVYDRYMNDPDFIVAGTSAGAMAATTLMMYEGENTESMLKGAVKISSGLGFLDRCIIDTHFTSRGRFGRLSQAVVMNPTCVGIGLSENTALLIRHGNNAVCVGSGMAVIIDGRNVEHTNIAYAENGEALCVENLKVHILCEGNGYLLEKRRFVASRKDITIERKTNIDLSAGKRPASKAQARKKKKETAKRNSSR